MSGNPPGPFRIDNVAMPTWILRYDKHGTCVSPLTRAALLNEVQGDKYTDIIAFSHGWNNDFDDAIALYGEFLQRFEQAVGSHPPGRPFKPLFFGIIWPSTWMDFDKGPQIAAADDPATSADSRGIAAGINELAEEIHAADGDIDRFYELMQKKTITKSEVDELAAIAGPVFASYSDDENGDGARGIGANDLAVMMDNLERAQTTGGAAPDLTTWGGIGGSPGAGDATAAGLLDKLDPRNLIRLFSVYQMKDRAGTVGYRGMAPLLRDVASVSMARIHSVGHSYGCKVMLSGICEPTAFSRALNSLLLLEPAISHLCFASSVPGSGTPGNEKPGGYRSALDTNRVLAPIFSTYSKKDFPLHDTFHLALRRAGDLGEAQIAAAADDSTSAGKPPSRYAALGGYGPRRADEELVDPLPAAGTAYPSLNDKTLMGLDGSNGIIKNHGDVKSDATVWALYQLVFR